MVDCDSLNVWCGGFLRICYSTKIEKELKQINSLNFYKLYLIMLFDVKYSALVAGNGLKVN